MSYRTLGVVAAFVSLAACGGHSNPIAPTPDPPAPSAATAGAVFVTPREVLPVGGGSTAIEIYTSLSADGRGAATFVPVHLEVSGGSLSTNDVLTDKTGHAKVDWSGETSATITAIAQDVRATTTVTVQRPGAPSPTPQPGCTGCQPSPIPSPVPPFIPAPPAPAPPPPPPPPPPAPSVAVTLNEAGSPAQEGGGTITLTATATPSDSTDTVIGYQWDFDGNGTFDATTTTNTIDHVYPLNGIYAPKVKVTTANGLTNTAATTVVITT